MVDYFKKISECYKPSVPIDDPDMFVGRLEEKSLLLRTLATPGRHALIYGLRGIGKTSLINITSKVFSFNSDTQYRVITHTCSYNDTYESILFSILNSAQLNLEESEKLKLIGKGKAGFNIPFLPTAGVEGGIEKEILKEKRIETKISPNYFCDLISDKYLLLVLDEFDRIKDIDTIILFSETLKILSDTNAPSKLLMAGVANAANDLFGGHLSINRSLINIQLPLMTDEELLEIINYGAGKLNIVFEEDVINIIIWLSDGMPFFTHLLAEELAANALFQNEKLITTTHLRSIIKNILKSRTYEIINHEYESILSDRQRPFIELNPLADQAFYEYQEPWTRKLVLHSFSFLSSRSKELSKDTLNIIKTFYPERAADKTIDNEDFLYQIDSILEYFARKDRLITFSGNDNYSFKDNFYKTFVRLKAISEIEEKEIRQLTLHCQKAG